MPQVSFLVYGQDNVSDSWDISDSFSDGVGLMGFFRVFWDLPSLPTTMRHLAHPELL